MIAGLAIALLAAAPDPFPFAPPIDRPLRYRQTEYRIGADGKPLRFTLIEEVRYARDGAGYIMTTRALSADAKAPPGVAAMFDAAMRPFLDIAVGLRLSATGDPGALIDPDGVWARVLAAGRGSVAAVPSSETPERRATLERTARDLATLSPEARDAVMKAPAVALLGLDVPDLAVGASAPLDLPVDAPSGGIAPTHGTIRREPDRDGTRRYLRDLASDDTGAIRLHRTGTIALSTSSGLLLSSTERIAAADPAAPGGERPLSSRELMLLP